MSKPKPTQRQIEQDAIRALYPGRVEEYARDYYTRRKYQLMGKCKNGLNPVNKDGSQCTYYEKEG